MAILVCVILILLNVFSQVVQTQQSTTPAPVTFDCVNGKIDNIDQADDGKDSLLVEYGSSGELCHITKDTCKHNLQNKETLHVIYDKAEKNKTSQFVAGKLYRYELKCQPGYVARASATALEIFSTPVQPYINQYNTQTPPQDAIKLQLFKGSNILTNKKVHVGDELKLKIIAKGPALLIPIKCTAVKSGSNSHNTNKHLLWDKNVCRASDNAIMSDDWTRIDDVSIGIDMYAFRFIDSLTVVIECSAYVCPLGDSECGQLMKNCMSTTVPSTTTPPPTKPTVLGRRRRHINQNDHKEKIASTSFTINDIYDNSSGCSGLSSNTLLYVTTLLVCMFISGRDSSN